MPDRRVTPDDLAEVDGPYHIYLVNIIEVGEARFPDLPLSAKTGAAVQDELNRHAGYDFQTGYANPWNQNEMILVMKDPNWTPAMPQHNPRRAYEPEPLSAEERAESARRSRRADLQTERQAEAWRRRART